MFSIIVNNKIKITIISSIIITIIAFGFQLRKIISENNQLKKTNILQSKRIADLNEDFEFSVNSIKKQFSLNFIQNCSDIRYLTDRNLSLDIDESSKIINQKEVIKILKLGPNSKIKDIMFDPSSFKNDIDIYKKLKIKKNSNGYLVKFKKDYINNSAHQIELVAIIENNSKFCKQNLRLFLSPKLNLSKGWRVFSAIGRSGLSRGTFSLPYGTEFFDNYLWSTDCSNENISVFDLNGHYINSFSKYGKKIGQLDTPADMKIFDKKIFVVEERNHRVQIFSINGEPLRVFGTYGKTEDFTKKVNNFNNPLGISVTKDQIVIADYQNQRILSYDHDFDFLWSTGNKKNDKFKIDNPYYIDYSKQKKHFLFSNQLASEIGVLGEDGKKITSFGSDILVTPFELAINDIGDLLVSDTVGQQVVIFDKVNYKVKNIFKFPEFFGIPKTITSISPNTFSVGFVGNGSAYFLIITKDNNLLRENFNKTEVNFKFSEKSDANLTNNNNTVILYNQFCASCHENGRYNAPARGNVEAWEKFSRSSYELLQNTINGKGSMIKKGGCTNCTNEDLTKLIEFMLPKSW